MTKRALIVAQECIGCTRCLAVCPTDAIVGADQLLHSVIEEDCIGCALCLPVCPVDCIILMPVQDTCDSHSMAHEARIQRKAEVQFLVQRREARLKRKQEENQTFFLTMRNKLRAQHESSCK